jgi:hypothetical protein
MWHGGIILFNLLTLQTMTLPAGKFETLEKCNAYVTENVNMLAANSGVYGHMQKAQMVIHTKCVERPADWKFNPLTFRRLGTDGMWPLREELG